jgi:hypothetical protein
MKNCNAVSLHIVFLETGNSRSGLRHILERHSVDLNNKGIAEADDEMKTPHPLRFQRFGLAAVCCLALSACAPMVPTTPSTIEISQPDATARRIQILTPTIVQLDTGYTRTLADKSIWSQVGRVPQGDVYRPVGTVFTIEGRQIHEAYLVIRDKKLVGFYLPGEQNYSPLSTAVPLNLGEIE